MTKHGRPTALGSYISRANILRSNARRRSSKAKNRRDWGLPGVKRDSLGGMERGEEAGYLPEDVHGVRGVWGVRGVTGVRGVWGMCRVWGVRGVWGM